MLYLVLFVLIIGYFTNKQNNQRTVYHKLDDARWEAYVALSHMRLAYKRHGNCVKAGLDYWQERYDKLYK